MSQILFNRTVKTNIIIAGDSDDTKENNLFCSDAQQLVEAVESISGSSENITECFTEGGSTRMRATKSADPQENWRLFGSKIRRLSGVLLLQTIGCVLKGIRVLNDEIDGKKITSIDDFNFLTHVGISNLSFPAILCLASFKRKSIKLIIKNSFFYL